METFQTRCPNCSTTFQITSELLDAADGQVRCGSCMHVFDGSEHLIGDIEEDEKEESSIISDDVFSLSDDEQSMPTSLSDEFSDSFLSLGGESSEQFFDESNGDALAEDSEDWTKALLDDDKPAARKKPTSPNQDLTESLPTPETNTEDDNEDFEHVFDEPSGISANAVSDNKQHLLKHIESDPLVFHIERRGMQLIRNVLFTIVCLIGLLALPSQIAYFKFETLAQNPNTRPALEFACPYLKCTLPRQADISQLRSSNLVVRSHSTIKGVLEVDTVLSNDANYSQDFPIIELVFLDSSGNIVAGKRLQASEYLQGELIGTSQLKPRQSVHLAIHVMDPGPRASGYQLAIKPAS